MKKVIYFLIFILYSCRSYDGRHYIVIKEVFYSYENTLVKADIVLDTLYTRKLYKVGDTLYFNKIKLHE